VRGAPPRARPAAATPAGVRRGDADPLPGAGPPAAGLRGPRLPRRQPPRDGAGRGRGAVAAVPRRAGRRRPRPRRRGGAFLAKGGGLMATLPLHGTWTGARVLITGGLGFIGSNLAIRLVRAGACVTLVDAMIPEYGGNLFNIAPVGERV